MRALLAHTTPSTRSLRRRLATASTTAHARRRFRDPPPLAVDDDDDDDDSATPSPSSRATWPCPLKGSLGDARSLVATPAPPAVIAATASRFPYANHFSVDGDTVPAPDLLTLLTPFVSDERVARFRAAASGRRFDVLPIIEGVHDRGNLGAICRTADALGIGALLAADVETGIDRQKGRCSAGAEKWVDVTVHRDTLAAVADAKARGFRIAVAAAGDGAVSAADLDWETPTAFIVGNEAMGVSDAARAAADVSVQIKMTGMVESLNVSVASALLMQAALARLTAVGVPGLSEEEIDVFAAILTARHKAQARQGGWRRGMLRELMERAGAEV